MFIFGKIVGNFLSASRRHSTPIDFTPVFGPCDSHFFGDRIGGLINNVGHIF